MSEQSVLQNVKRCPAVVNGQPCNSPVFYDWGIQVMGSWSGTTPVGIRQKTNNWADTEHVKICARCTTPYIIVEGDLVDISDELTAEDVKLILSRGQAQLPHPKIKDP